MAMLPSSSSKGLCTVGETPVRLSDDEIVGMGVTMLPGEKCTWNLSDEKLMQCAAAETGDVISSPIFKLSNGTLWKFDLFPKGLEESAIHSDSEGFISVYLLWLICNPEVSGFEECTAGFTLRANGKEDFICTTFNYKKGDDSFGSNRLGPSPSFASGSKFTVELEMTVMKLKACASRKKPSFDDWFKTVPYPQYRDALEREGYDTIEAIRLLDDAELQRIGVTRVGHRRVVLKAIAALEDA